MILLVVFVAVFFSWLWNMKLMNLRHLTASFEQILPSQEWWQHTQGNVVVSFLLHSYIVLQDDLLSLLNNHMIQSCTFKGIMYINNNIKRETECNMYFYICICIGEGQVRSTLNQLLDHVLVMLQTRTSWCLKSIHSRCEIPFIP